MTSPRRSAIAVALWALFSTSLVPVVQAGVIKGRVVDESGQGVQGVDIDVETPAGSDVEIDSDGTNATGHFETSVPDGSSFVVLFNPPGPLKDQLVTTVLGDVAISGTVQLGTITLRDGVVLSGRVVDSVGQPVAGVDLDVVELETDEDLELSGDNTDALGRFQITILTTAVEVQFETANLGGPTLAPQAMELQSATDLDLGDVALDPGFQVSGSVVGIDDEPVVGADLDVFVTGTQTRVFTPQDDSGPGGVFGIVLAAGTYDIRVDPPFGAGVLTGFFEGVDIAGDTNIGALSLGAGELALPIHLGDKLEGTLTLDDVDAVRFSAPAGTRVTLTLKAVKGSGLKPSLRLSDPDDATLVTSAESVASSKLARIKNLTLASSGVYRLELTPAASTGGYTLTTKAVYPTKAKAVLTVPDEATMDFGALEDWSVKKLKLKAKPAKGTDPLIPLLVLRAPSGGEIDLADSASSNSAGTLLKVGNLTLPEDGIYTLEVGGEDGTSGPVAVTLKLHVPKPTCETHVDPDLLP